MKAKKLALFAIAAFAAFAIAGCGSSADEQLPDDTTYQTVEMEGITFEAPDDYLCKIGYYTGVVEAQLKSIDMSSAPVNVILEGNSAGLTPKNIMDQEEIAKVDRANVKSWKCKKVDDVKIDGALCQTYEYSWEDEASGTEKKVYRALITNNNIFIDVKSEKHANLNPAVGVVNHIVSTIKIPDELTVPKNEEESKPSEGAAVAGTHQLSGGDGENATEEQSVDMMNDQGEDIADEQAE